MGGNASVDEMGYVLSRLEMDSNMSNGEEATHGPCGNKKHDGQLPAFDNDISHLTNLRSAPSEIIHKLAASRKNLPISTVKMLAAREANYSGQGRFSQAECSHVLSRYLPVNGPRLVDNMSSRAYISQFSSDGTLFVAGFQDRHIRIYDVDHGWRVHKDILTKNLRWTITDTSLSPDQRYLVYASISPIVHIVNVGAGPSESHANITDIHEGLIFATDENELQSFGIFSIKFSTDGRELVAGCSDDALYVYDLEANKVTLRIPAHSSDVNSVSFADETGHLIYSGSDDSLCKVWDRRCFNANGRPAGILEGHLQGITFLDSRGDGRYFISNGKDQTTKLWDIRKMSSKSSSYRARRVYDEWDYRWNEYPSSARNFKHPNDQSVATYRGHLVLKTLIRCYFSPASSTGQKYIYTGSHDNCVYIYDVVSGDIVAKLDYHKATIRDCSWHPLYPMFVTSSWDGGIASWEFPGMDKACAVGRKKSRRRHAY